MEGVKRLVKAGIATVVRTGAVNSKLAVAKVKHTQKIDAQGLMAIPRLLSHGPSSTVQKADFKAILPAAPDLPAASNNSPISAFSRRPICC